MDRYLEEAGNFFIKKDYKKAIEHYYKALTTENDNIFILNKIAQCYVFLDNPDKAIFNYEKIIELEPDNIENYLNISQVYEAKNDKNQTVEYLKQALNIDPNNTIILEMLIKLLYENEQFQEAYEYTKSRLINLKPTSANYFTLGEIAEKLNKESEAQTYFEKSVNINPKNIDVKIVLANLLFKNGKPDEAKKHLIDVFVIDSNNVDARKLLGEIFIEQNDYQKAIEEFNSVLTQRGNDYETAFSKAYCYSMLKKNKLAIDILKEQLSKYPDNSDIKIALANNFLALGKTSKALNVLKYNDDIDSNIDAQRILGEICLLTKKYSRALESFNKVLDKEPNDVYSLGKKGMVLKTLGLYDDAIKCLLKVTKIKPDDEEINLNIADIYIEEKNYKKALNQYEKILGNNIDCYGAILGTANVLYNLNKLNDAQEYYLKAIHINPNEHCAYCKLAEILYKNKEYELALNYIFEAIKLQTNDDYYHFMAAKILCENGILDKALKEYTIAVQNNPCNITYITEYTDVMFLTGHIEQAIKTLKKALRIEKNNTEILKRLVLFSEETKNKEQSGKYQKILDKITKSKGV